MSLSEKLYQLYSQTNELIKFAETKNAALIAFNGAVILGVLKLISDFKSAHWLIIYLFFVLAMNVISAFIMIVALAPQMISQVQTSSAGKGTNLLYFGSIAKLSPEDYVDRLNKVYGFTSDNAAYERDLARELIIVCQIAVRKFKLFKLAMAWTFAGITTPLGILVYLFFFEPSRKQPKA